MKKILALGLILFVFVAACGKKEVKKISPDSRMSLDAFDVSEKLRNAYLKNDRAEMEKYTTREGYVSMVNARKNFDSAELTFSPVLVEIYGDTVHCYVSWNGTWKKEGKSIEDRGLAVFVMKERPLKLDEIMRDNPFSKPE